MSDKEIGPIDDYLAVGGVVIWKKSSGDIRIQCSPYDVVCVPNNLIRPLAEALAAIADGKA